MPFHVRVSTDEGRRRLDRTNEVFAFHISEAAVRERFVDPWLAGEDVLSDGLSFAREHTRLEIYEGSTYSSQPFRTRDDWEHVKLDGRNVTDSFVRRGKLVTRTTVDVAKNPARVMVVHGRDTAARSAMFAFLRSLSLEPIEWSQAISATGDGAPYNAQAVDAAFGLAQAALVLCTPDEHVLLREGLRDQDDPAEAALASQPRPNVFFEGGIAFTSHPARTIVVEVGRVRVASDLLGRNVVRVNRKPEWRQDLAGRLKQAGCSVDRSGTDWLSVGGFEQLDALQPSLDAAVALNSTHEPDPSLAVRREARHLGIELATIDRTIESAVSNGYWWNVALDGLPSIQWQTSRDGLADHAGDVYDTVAEVYVEVDQLNKAAYNSTQGGIDELTDAIGDRMRALRQDLAEARVALKDYASGLRPS